MSKGLAALFGCLVFSQLCLAADDGKEQKSCAGFDGSGLKNILPIVITLPLFVSDRREDEIKSCIAVVYGLKTSRRFKGSLLPRKPKVVAYSSDVSAKDVEEVQKAFKGWHFQKKHGASEEPIYYSIIEF